METALSRRTRAALIIAALLLHVSALIFLVHHRFQFISKPVFIFFQREQKIPKSIQPEQSPIQFVSHDAAVEAFPEEIPAPITEERIPSEESLEKNQPNNPPEEQPVQTQQVGKQAEVTVPKPQEKPEATAQPEPHIPQAKPNNKKLTLAQLARGFKNYLKKENQSMSGHNSCAVAIGEKGGIPTAAQLQFERYSERIYQCLQKSYTIHKYQGLLNKLTAKNLNDMKDMHITIALHKDGSINILQLTNPSGIKELDDFVLFVFREASSEFPPVPDSIYPYATTFCNPISLFVYQLPFSQLTLTVLQK